MKDVFTIQPLIASMESLSLIDKVQVTSPVSIPESLCTKYHSESLGMIEHGHEDIIQSLLPDIFWISFLKVHSVVWISFQKECAVELMQLNTAPGHPAHSLQHCLPNSSAAVLW